MMTTMYRCLDNKGNEVMTQYVDEEGRPVGRSPLTYPYSYDSFVVWGKKTEGTSAVYSDRLYQWESEKYNKLCRKHFGNEGQIWYDREPEKTEAFLREYLEMPDLVLTMIMQGCNQSYGSPLWIFFYRGELT